MQHLYRHFAADGTLLYVGISLSAMQRLQGHKKRAIWFEEIATVTLEKFDTRELVKIAERNAIKTEKPKYNILLNKPKLEAKPQKLKKVKNPHFNKRKKYKFELDSSYNHKLDCSQIDQLDEIGDGEQYCLVWCETHQKYEWHWLQEELINTKSKLCTGYKVSA